MARYVHPYFRRGSDNGWSRGGRLRGFVQGPGLLEEGPLSMASRGHCPVCFAALHHPPDDPIYGPGFGQHHSSCPRPDIEIVDTPSSPGMPGKAVIRWDTGRLHPFREYESAYGHINPLDEDEVLMCCRYEARCEGRPDP